MPYIRSANPNFDRKDAPGEYLEYIHGAASRRTFIPMAFQVTSPFDTRRVLLPHALVLHVNPSTFNEVFNKKVERFQTLGGFVEQHWGDDLSEVSADGSTGAFMNIYTGLSSVLRRRTIAWDRFRDLHDLYRHNGSVYDPRGNIVLQGQIMLMFDRGTLLGTFRNFEFDETVDSPFAFKVNWSFKVEHIIFYIPGAKTGQPVYGPAARAPSFQSQNTDKALNAAAAATSVSEAEQKAVGEAWASGAMSAGQSLYQGAKELLGIAQAERDKENLRNQRTEQMRQAMGAPSSQDIRDQQARELGIPTQSGKPR